jgi:hypothetical protein
VRYVQRLTDEQFAEALRQNHALWSAGRSLDDRARSSRRAPSASAPSTRATIGAAKVSPRASSAR